MRFSLSARPRCGCRDPASGKQLGARCPRLGRGGHGAWTWQLKGRELQEIAASARLRGGGHQTRRKALAKGDEVRRVLEVVEPGDAAALAQVVDLVTEALAAKTPLPSVEELRLRYAAGAALDKTITVTEYLTKWLKTRKLRRSTLRSYESHIRVHLIPHLGNVPVGKLRVSHIAGMFAAIEAENEVIVQDNEARRAVDLALREARKRHDREASRHLRDQLAQMPPYRRPTGPSARQRIRAVLRKALNDARRKEGLILTNPAADIELDPAPRPKPLVWTEQRVKRWQETGEVPSAVMVWTPQQTAMFLNHAHGHPRYALFHLVAHRGLRRGEAVGLPWSDADLDAKTIAIRQQLTQIGWQVETSRPKSDAGERTVALDDGTVAALEAHRAQQRRDRQAWGDGWVNSGLVFVREDGSPLHPASVTTIFKKLAAKAGLPPIRFHDLRHGAATMALAAGTDVKVVQELLGHSTSRLTRDVYTSVLPELQRIAAEAVAALLAGAQKTGDPAANRPGLTSASQRENKKDAINDEKTKPLVRPLEPEGIDRDQTSDQFITSESLCRLS